MQARCSGIVDDLMRNDIDGFFLRPVDPKKLQIPDYFTIIKTPMDLGTIKKRLDSKYYHSFLAVEEDIRLVWINAKMYNPVSPLFLASPVIHFLASIPSRATLFVMLRFSWRIYSIVSGRR